MENNCGWRSLKRRQNMEWSQAVNQEFVDVFCSSLRSNRNGEYNDDIPYCTEARYLVIINESFPLGPHQCSSHHHKQQLRILLLSCVTGFWTLSFCEPKTKIILHVSLFHKNILTITNFEHPLYVILSTSLLLFSPVFKYSHLNLAIKK